MNCACIRSCDVSVWVRRGAVSRPRVGRASVCFQRILSRATYQPQGRACLYVAPAVTKKFNHDEDERRRRRAFSLRAS